MGIIIIDEEHDDSYKSDQIPRYDAIEVAEKLTKDNFCPLVLGSATPSINTFYKAKTGKINLLTLKNRVNNNPMPNVEIINLREEHSKLNHSMISKKLKNEILKNKENNEQTILFLNRRGFSPYLICEECGEVVNCDRCAVSMTYHKNENILKCHYCGKEDKNTGICKNCGSNRLKYSGAGTEKLEEEIKNIFPEISVLRMDLDTVSKKNSHEEILKEFQEKNIDILIGTQMIVKGHDFKNVTLVGVILADNSLNTGEYKATENTFQILTQVARKIW